jgi:RimJ/RimL family protein N-acetyltransferase
MSEIQLETPRLILRQWRESDFEPYADICADRDVMRYLGGGKPLTRQEAWRHMAFLVGHWQLLGYGHFAVEEKQTRQLIGRIGFLNPEGWPGFELGWTLSRMSWGKGYASEGARRALEYAFDELDKDHVISLIHPENSASIRVAERLGEKQEGTAEVMGIPVLVFGIDRTTYVRKQ